MDSSRRESFDLRARPVGSGEVVGVVDWGERGCGVRRVGERASWLLI